MQVATYCDCLDETFICMVQNIQRCPRPPIKHVDRAVVAAPNHQFGVFCEGYLFGHTFDRCTGRVGPYVCSIVQLM
jgi:hypothetical protein